METMNKFGVIHTTGQYCLFRIMVPPHGLISREDALNLAAWLYVTASDDDEVWENLVKNVRGS